MDEEQAEDDTMSNSISIDGERVEMSWNEKIEELLKRWSEECSKLSEKHNEASKRKKCIHYGLQIPIIIAPFVSGFSNYVLRRRPRLQQVCELVWELDTGGNEWCEHLH